MSTQVVGWLPVRGGTGLPMAFSGLRTALAALREVAPGTVERHATQHPVEWNRLYPGSFEGVGDLSEIALSPSERRLHRESEQVFRVLLAASRAVVDACAEARVGLAVVDVGRWDLVSLRGLLLVAERTRLSGEVPLQLGGWEPAVPWRLRRYGGVREHHLELLRQRLDVAEPSTMPASASPPSGTESVDARWLEEATGRAGSCTERLAAAIAAIRSCFFSTNYEGALLAIEAGLDELERPGVCPDANALAEALGTRDEGLTSPAMEVDLDLLDGEPQVRAFFLKAAGVVHALVGENERALSSFATALGSSTNPVQRAQIRMFRGLVLSKRLHEADAALAELDAGLSEVLGRDEAPARRERGWLRNVGGLVRFMDGQPGRALAEERSAIEEVGSLSDPSATHLKINLISNLSVLQESVGRFDDALRTWERFTEISDDWNDNFVKHHTYRSAGLLLAAGCDDEAVARYGMAYEAAGKLADDYHQHVVSCELGTLAYRNGDHELAAERFGQALSHAEEVGDPLWVAQSLVGQALAGEGPSTRLLAKARSAAAATNAKAKAAGPLLEVLGTGDLDALAQTMPAPTSKLNRPFDLANVP